MAPYLSDLIERADASEHQLDEEARGEWTLLLRVEMRKSVIAFLSELSGIKGVRRQAKFLKEGSTFQSSDILRLSLNSLSLKWIHGGFHEKENKDYHVYAIFSTKLPEGKIPFKERAIDLDPSTMDPYSMQEYSGVEDYYFMEFARKSVGEGRSHPLVMNIPEQNEDFCGNDDLYNQDSLLAVMIDTKCLKEEDSKAVRAGMDVINDLEMLKK